MRIKNTLFVGKVFREFSSLPSTNVYALQLVSKSEPNEGTVVSTFHQTEGRGQVGNRWESEPGQNISLSLILYPAFLTANRQFLLNQAVALAVSDLAARYAGEGVKVKWPNDIYVHDRKLAGILIQNALSGRRLQSSVVGVGLNVNQRDFAPPLSRATSLRLETGRTHDLYEVIEVLCVDLEQRYLQLRSGQETELKRAYIHRLYRYGEWAAYRTPAGDDFLGRITGVGETGRLQMETETGVRSFDLKEVQFV